MDLDLCSVMRREDKPWGTCVHLLETPHMQIDVCEIVAGGYSSIHLHRHKANQFTVISGELRVRIFDVGGFQRQTWRLSAGGTATVDAG